MKHILLSLTILISLTISSDIYASPYDSINFNYKNQQAGALDSLSSFFNTIFSNITTQSHAQTPDITTGLIAHWKFDEGTGTTASDSAGSNTGTLTNGPIFMGRC